MNKLCVSLGHCCGPVTMVSVVRGQRNVVLLGNRDAEGGRREIWREVFALDYFSNWSHLHLLTQEQPLSLSSAVFHCPSLNISSSIPACFSHWIQCTSSLTLYFCDRDPVTVPLSSPALTFISDLAPESLHSVQCLCVALWPYFLLAYHLLLSSADWMNPCFWCL